MRSEALKKCAKMRKKCALCCKIGLWTYAYFGPPCHEKNIYFLAKLLSYGEIASFLGPTHISDHF
jgi:hypothetical protein